MADEKITDQPVLSDVADGDISHVVDVSDDTSKQATQSLLRTYMQGTLPADIADNADSNTRQNAVLSQGSLSAIIDITQANISDVTV